jgi:Na+/phosphate symporter
MARMAANFHTAFNLVLAIAFVLFLDQLAALLIRLLPTEVKTLILLASFIWRKLQSAHPRLR